MSQGEKRGADINLMDLTYDAHRDEHYLWGGLGQLTDGVEGASNFRLDPLGLGIKGYEWVGWRNESFGGKPVEIIFKFDYVRNFTSLRFECNNLFKKDVRVFREADIYFSIAGEYYVTDPVVYKFMRDTLIEYARPIIIGLNNNVGQYVKVLLHFDARWLLISEVMFESGKSSRIVFDIVNISHEIWRVYPMNYIHGFVVLCFVVVILSFLTMYLPIFFRVASLALGQSYDCPSVSAATLRDMGKIST